MGHVDEQDVRVVDRMARLGRAFARRIMLQVNPRQALLFGRQNLVLVDRVVTFRLEQHTVEIEVPDLFRGHLVEVLARATFRTVRHSPPAVRP